MLQHIFKGCQRVLAVSCHFLKKRMNSQEFAERLWETMNGMGRDILRVVRDAEDEGIHRERATPSRWSEGVTQGPSSPSLGMFPQGEKNTCTSSMTGWF